MRMAAELIGCEGWGEWRQKEGRGEAEERNDVSSRWPGRGRRGGQRKSERASTHASDARGLGAGGDTPSGEHGEDHAGRGREGKESREEGGKGRGRALEVRRGAPGEDGQGEARGLSLGYHPLWDVAST